MAGENLVETVRLILQCPISHSHEEGVIMDVLDFILAAKTDKHSVWNHFHSSPWPPSFFASEAGGSEKTPLARQGIVIFTIDCRSPEHAKVFLKQLRNQLRKLYSAADRSEAHFTVFVHKGERQDWST